MFGSGAVSSSAVALPARVLCSAMTTPPTGARAVLINDLIQRLIIANVWSTLDVMYVLAAADSQAAGLNWVTPASFACTAVNSPTFTADRGYAGDGATSYVDTNWNLVTNAVRISQNSVFSGCWAVTNPQSTGYNFGQTSVRQNSRTAADFFANRLCSNTTNTGTVANTTTGHKAQLRSAGANYTNWSNGTNLETITQTSAALLPNKVFIGCSNLGGFNNGTTRQIGALHMGASVSTTQVGQLYTALLTYMQAVGAA